MMYPEVLVNSRCLMTATLCVEGGEGSDHSPALPHFSSMDREPGVQRRQAMSSGHTASSNSHLTAKLSRGG